MYTPEIYKNYNQTEINNFLEQNSFGILINQTNGKPWGTHIPLELETTSDGNQQLVGHVSLENPQAQSLVNGSEVLCIFSGPHSYISPSWYDHENVPTWNYQSVHVYGTITILDYTDTIHSLKKLVDKYETNSQKPVRIEKMSKETMLQARDILGFTVTITEIQATNKMSQNRDEKNLKNIISELQKTNKTKEIEVAELMKKCPMGH